MECPERPSARSSIAIWSATAMGSCAGESLARPFERLQAERVAAFSEFVADVNSMAYPEEKHIVRMAPEELKAFMAKIDS